MKDKLSKVKNLVKKYGLTGTIKKMTGYIYSNYINYSFYLSLCQQYNLAEIEKQEGADDYERKNYLSKRRKI